jgi:hypothetical protein
MRPHIMQEGEVEKRFEAIDQALAVAGEELEAMKRSQRQFMDEIRIELEVFRRCLTRLDPELAECYKVIREEVVHEVDPEKA